MLGTEGHTASQAELERLSSRVIRSYSARCAARAEVRERKCAEDRERYVPGVFSVIADGTFAMAHKGSKWSLLLEWNEEYGQRLLARGSLAHVERYALEVAVHGPPGGPDVRQQGSEWRDIGGDGTLHSLALGGEFRLMPLFDGGHILTFARNDSPLRVLGIGEAAELQRTAVERHDRFRGDVLHVVLGDERIELRGVAAAGVLGYLEMYDGSMLLLGNLDGERFGLFRVRGNSGDCVGLYDFDMLCRGDLKKVLGWASTNFRDEDDGEGDLAGLDARQVEPDPPARVAPPSQPAIAPGPRPAVEPDPRVRVVPTTRTRLSAADLEQPQPPPKTSTTRTRLSVADLELIDEHLTLIEPTSGRGMSVFPKLLVCLRALPSLGLPNLLMRGCDLQRLFKEEFGVEFYCCSKTFGQALAAVAAKTPLLKAVGKRWFVPVGDLRIADPELLREIAMVTPRAKTRDAPTVSAPASSMVGTPRSPAPPAPDPQPMAAPATCGSSTAGTRSPEPPASDPQPAAESPTSPASGPACASPPVGVPAAAGHPDDRSPHGAPLEPDDDREPLVDQRWLIAKGFRRYQPMPRDGPLRSTSASVPDAESASRWRGKKPRGPP